jgi:hypothetical protein
MLLREGGEALGGVQKGVTVIRAGVDQRGEQATHRFRYYGTWGGMFKFHPRHAGRRECLGHL